VDWDDCVDGDGKIHPEVQHWTSWFPTYQEISPSRTGQHFICRGTIAKSLVGTPLPKAPGVKVEAYAKGRFFCFTGWRIADETRIQNCETGFAKLLAHLKVDESRASESAPKNEKLVTLHHIRQLYEDKLNELRAAPQGAGNSTLNNTALIAARVCASRVFEKTENQFKQELLDIVTKAWKQPPPRIRRSFNNQQRLAERRQ